MTPGHGPDDLIRSFVAGKLTFDRLVTALRALVSGGEPASLVEQALIDAVNAGRVPADLADLVRHAMASEPQAESETLDPPTEPYATRSSGAGPADDPFREKIDKVILSALVADFRHFREGAGQGRGPGADERHLDDALSSFRSARFRRDARNAADGRARAAATARPRTAAAVGVGTILKDRFILDRELGRGGMGIVYRAVDRRRLEARHAQPYVALKLLTGSFRNHPEAFRTLEAEARKVQDLAHPNIVTVHDFDRDGSNVFMVMALLEGRTLEDALQEPGEGAFDADAVIEGMCRGLDYAHSRDVVHSDLKPGNVFLTRDDGVKVLDFGIASAGRLSGFDAASLDALTLSYASPEMIDGEPRDPRDDVYALGCVVFRMVTGHHPFDGLSASEARRLTMTVPSHPALKGQPLAAVRAALSFSRADRPANAGAFLAAYRGRSLMDRMFRR